MIGHHRTRRREFIGLLGAAAACAFVARAQGPRDRPARIGILRSSPTPERWLDAFRHGLAESGYAEGRNYVLVFRFGDGDSRKLPELATALVAAGVDVTVTEGSLAARAARAATGTIPIVMTTSPDPVRAGLADNLARPGGNVTGLASQMGELSGKLLEFLKAVVPGLARVALIMARPAWDAFRPEMTEAARALGLDIVPIELGLTDTDAAVRQAVAAKAQPAVVRGRPFFSTPHMKTHG